MSDSYNIGAAILAVGVMWIGFTFGWGGNMSLVALGTIALVVCSWAYPGFSEGRKKYLRAQTAYYEAMADYYRRKQA